MFDAWFTDSLAGSPLRSADRLIRHGDVVRSAAAAVKALGDGASGKTEPPAAILVHEALPGFTSHGRGEGVLALLHALPSLFESQSPPPCILIAGRLHPPEIQRFRLAGGAHVIDWSTQSWGQRRHVLRAAIRGSRWHHTPCPPLLEFTTRDLDLLPCLEADLSPNETARHLGLSDQQVHDSRRALYARLLKAEAVEFVLAGHTTALATAAMHAGAIWVPLTRSS